MVLVRSLKFDGTVKRSWNCEPVFIGETDLVLTGVFEDDVDHPELGLIRKGTLSREYYWLNRWFNVFEFRESDGTLRNFYCNIGMPPAFVDGKVEYVDLDVDLVIWPNGQYEILDLDEFRTSAEIHGFSREILENVDQALMELLSILERRDFPFGSLQTC